MNATQISRSSVGRFITVPSPQGASCAVIAAVIAATCGTLPFPGQAKSQTVVAIQMGPYFSTAVVDNKQALLRAAAGGTYSLHAVTNMKGQGDYQHKPGNQPANVNTIFPVKLVTDPLDPDGSTDIAAPTPLPQGAKYLDAAKNFNAPGQAPVKVATGQAKQMFTTPADAARNLLAFTTTATALAQIAFSQPRADVYLVNPAGTYASVEKPNQSRPFPLDFFVARRGPEGTKSGSLVLDPLTYNGVEQGDLLTGVVGFTKDDFQAQVNDPLGKGIMTSEVGTDVLGPSLGPLGGSFQNNLPLAFRLTVSLTPDAAPSIRFDFNPAFTFFNPDDPQDILSPGAILSFVTNRFNAALTPGANPADLYTLAADVSLIGYEAVAAADMETMNIDYMSGQVVQAPEPAGLALALLGGLGAWDYTTRRATRGAR